MLEHIRSKFKKQGAGEIVSQRKRSVIVKDATEEVSNSGWLSEPLGDTRAVTGWLEDLNSGSQTLKEQYALMTLRPHNLSKQTLESLDGIPEDVIWGSNTRFQVNELRYSCRDGSLEDVTGWPTLLGFLVNDNETGKCHLPTTDQLGIQNWNKLGPRYQSLYDDNPFIKIHDTQKAS